MKKEEAELILKLNVSLEYDTKKAIQFIFDRLIREFKERKMGAAIYNDRYLGNYRVTINDIEVVDYV